MDNVNTQDILVDVATKYFSPFLSECEDFDTFIRLVHKKMDSIKTKVVRNCIQQFDEELRQNIPDGWKIIKKIKRNVICVFGKISFKRTLFLDQYGRRRYLCDELLGIAPHSRFSSDAFIWLMNTITRLSYGETSKAFKELSGVKVSKMGIWFMVQKECELLETNKHGPVDIPITQDTICVETDGVFVALQSPKRRNEVINRFFCRQQHHKQSLEIKCCSVYAGKVNDGNRVRRVNAEFLAGNYSAPRFWNNIVSRIEQSYDKDYLENIFYGSDAGGWCKNQMLDTNNSLHAKVEQTIDRYHVMQAIWKAFPKGTTQD